MRKTFLPPAAAIIWFASAPLFAQTPAPAPAFEVASVKPAPPIAPAQVMAGKIHVGMAVDGARVDIGNLSLRDLLCIAYRVKPYQLSGPDWLGAQRFDILAKLPEGATREQVPEMLQALLAERFQMAVHRDSKEEPVYELVVAKNGPKLKESEPDAAKADGAAPPPPPGGGAQVNIARDGKGVTVMGGQPGAGPTRVAMGPNGAMHLEASKMTMARFADMLSNFAGRPVVDMTDLKGSYDVALDLSMEEMRNAARAAGVMVSGGPGPGPGGPGPAGLPGRAPVPEASDPSASSIFTAVQQLGLKLEPRKDPVVTIVVDHAEKMPSDN